MARRRRRRFGDIAFLHGSAMQFYLLCYPGGSNVCFYPSAPEGTARWHHPCAEPGAESCNEPTGKLTRSGRRRGPQAGTVSSAQTGVVRLPS